VKKLHDHIKDFIKPQEQALAPAAITGLQRYVWEIERLANFRLSAVATGNVPESFTGVFSNMQHR
jgi:hypothetical protein